MAPRALSKKAFRKKKPKLPRRPWKKQAPKSSSSKRRPCVYSPRVKQQADGWWQLPPAFFRSRPYLAVNGIPTGKVAQAVGLARFSGSRRRRLPNKQVTKLGNADGLLIY